MSEELIKPKIENRIMKKGQSGITNEVVRWVLILVLLIAVIAFMASIAGVIDFDIFRTLR